MCHLHGQDGQGQQHAGDGADGGAEHDAYRHALERLLRDLKVEVSPAPDG